MANQPSRQKQPFGLWLPYWTNRQTPTPRPPPSPASRSAPRSSPPAPVQPHRRPYRSPPPSPSPPSPLPSPSRKPAPPKTTRQGPPPSPARSSQLVKSSPTESPRQPPPPRASRTPSPSPSPSERAQTGSSRKQQTDEPQSPSSQITIQLQESQHATDPLSLSLLPTEADAQTASAQGAQGIETEKGSPENVNPKTVAKLSDGDGPKQMLILETKHEQVPEEPKPKQKEESTMVMEKNSTAEQLQVTKEPEPHQPEMLVSRMVMKTTRHPLEATETMTGVSCSGKQETVSASTGKEHNTTASSISRPSSIQSFHKDIKEGMSKLVQKLSFGQSQPMSNEGALSIITLAGENNGASMYIGHETLKEGTDHPRKKDYLYDKENGNEGRNSEKKTNQFSKESDKTSPAYPSPVTINSNVQSINNSLLHGSSCSQEDPGIHLVFKSKTKRQFTKEDDVRSLQSTSKSAVSITPVQEFTYDPNIRSIHLA